MPQSILNIATPSHGRVIVRAPDGVPCAGVLVGFHGYAETADIQMSRLKAIPGTKAWLLVAVQALHRFYIGRSDRVAASWMTREDRLDAIADNVQYVDRALDAAAPESGHAPLVFAGFSQGVPMAYRAAVLGRRPAAGVIAVGGEIPPELAGDSSIRFPPVLIVRGAGDDWYGETRRAEDAGNLASRGSLAQSITIEGAHDWTSEAGRAAGHFLSTLHAR